jgi:hypothetical protein
VIYEIHALDPGAKPGYAVLYPGGQLVTSTSPIEPRGEFGVVVERPAIRRGAPGKINPQSVVTLAFTSGRQFAELYSRPGCRSRTELSVDEWKGALYRGGGRIKKEVFTERLRRDLDLKYCTADEVDAAGIAWALCALKGKKCT